MNWTQRETAAGTKSVTSFDSSALVPGSYTAGISANALSQMMISAVALLPANPGVSPVFVQGRAMATSSTSGTLAFTGNVNAGDTIVVDLSFTGVFGAINSTVTDSLGNTYNRIALGNKTGSVEHCEIWVAYNVTGGACTITVTQDVAADPGFAVAIHEYSGVLTPPVSTVQFKTGFTNQDIWPPPALLPLGTSGQIVGFTAGIGGSLPSGISAYPALDTVSLVYFNGTDGRNEFQVFATYGTGYHAPVTMQIFADGANWDASLSTTLLSIPLTANQRGDLLHMATSLGASAIAAPVGPGGGPDWLITYEYGGSPASGAYYDRTTYLYDSQGSQHSFNLQARQRGQASYTLVHDPDNPASMPATYRPATGQPIYLYDQNASGFTLVFAGFVQDYTVRVVGNAGIIFIDVNAVSLESVFDTIYVDGTDSFANQTCGAILTALYNKYEAGCPVTLGTISAGATIASFVPNKGDKLSDIFDQLALTSQFTWNVNPQTQKLYFCAPSAVAAPFQITSTNPLWDSIKIRTDAADKRNWQGIKGSYDAFPHSNEFFQGAGQQSITLLRPVEQVVAAWITLSTCNKATGSLSGLPSDGDTITIGPANGAWQASHIYGTGGAIVFNGFLFIVTTAGISGGSLPNFAANTVLGDTVPDNTVIWTCQGPLGLSTGAQTYTWKTVIDNTQFGQILIGATAAACIQNLVDCLNANVAVRGTTFSLPTWENAQCNALPPTGASFVLEQKGPGSGTVAQLSSTGTAFAWSAPVTSGGTSPQGSVGPNQGATISIQVYQEGTNNAAPGLAYTKGSPVVTLATPLNSGTNLTVEYTRTDGNIIEVANFPAIESLALITNGTGKYMQMSDQSSQGLVTTSALALLQLAQEALATYDIDAIELDIDIHQPGILPLQEVVVNLSGALSWLNATYFVEEVSAQLVEGIYPYLDSPAVVGGGHYRYTLRLINVSQIGSYMDFWEQMGGTGSGGGAGASLVATSGGAMNPSGQPTLNIEVNDVTASSQSTLDLEAGTGISITDLGSGKIQFSAAGASSVLAGKKYTQSWVSQTSVAVNHNFGTSAVIVQVYDGSGNKVDPQNIAVTNPNTVTLTFGAPFTGSVVVLAVGAVTTGRNYTQSWVAQTSVTVTHNLNSTNVAVQVFDASGNKVTPQNVALTSANVVTLTFGAAFTGSVVVLLISNPAVVEEYNTTFPSGTSVTVTHNLNTTAVIVQVFDGSGNQVTPQNIQATSVNVVTLTFGASFAGSVTVIG